MEDKTMDKIMMTAKWLIYIAAVIVGGLVLTQCAQPDVNHKVVETKEFTQDTDKPDSKLETTDSRDAKVETPQKQEPTKEERRREPRYTEEPEEVPTFDVLSDGTIWYNNVKDNYTFKFPAWLQKDFTKSGELQLSGNALNATQLKDSDAFKADSMTIDVNYLPLPEGSDFDTWFASLIISFDEWSTFNNWNYKVEAILDSGGPFMRRDYVNISDNGALEVIFTYYSSPDIHDPTFKKKAQEAFGMVNFTATELFLSN